MNKKLSLEQLNQRLDDNNDFKAQLNDFENDFNTKINQLAKNMAEENKRLNQRLDAFERRLKEQKEKDQQAYDRWWEANKERIMSQNASSEEDDEDDEAEGDDETDWITIDENNAVHLIVNADDISHIRVDESNNLHIWKRQS